LVVKINQPDLITKNLSDIKLITKIEAVLYLKGRPISKNDLSEITNADINSIINAIKKLKIKYSSTDSAIQLNEINNTYCLELRSTLNDFVEDLLPSELKTSELRTLATIAIKKKILQSDLIVLRGSGAYDHIRELLNKKFILRRKQKDGRSYWLTLSEKFFQTFAVSNEYLSQIGGNKKKMLD
tara:strand:+ start:58 stop:609 length:552 start_codon:yes stop_codon:yes gene_type:complete